MQAAGQFQNSLRSLPAAGQPKRIVIPDKYGIDREMMVNDKTLDYLRAIVQTADRQKQALGSSGYNFGAFVGQSSLGVCHLGLQEQAPSARLALKDQQQQAQLSGNILMYFQRSLFKRENNLVVM